MLGRGVVLAVVALALLRGWVELALLAILAVTGFYAGKVAWNAIQDRRNIKRVLLGVGVVSAALAVLGFGGFLSALTVGGYALWGPLVGFGAAFCFGGLLGLEKRTDALKFRMMLELYPPSEGGGWDARRMEEATNGAVTADSFEAMRDGRGSVLGPSPEEDAALARAMDFPLELRYRKFSWWEKLYEDWKKGDDVRDKLYEWDCVTPERAAERLETSPDEILRMVEVGELEGRKGRDGRWQIREHGIFEHELDRRGEGHLPLPPHPRNTRPGRTGSANTLDRFGRPF